MLGSVLSRTIVLKLNVVGCRKFVSYMTRLSCLHTYHFKSFSPGRFAESKNFRILPRIIFQSLSLGAPVEPVICFPPRPQPLEFQ